MQARGLLMIEHRLIERMIEHRLIERMLSVVKDVLTKIEATHKVNPVFVDIAVDFIRVYADRSHHGKEEDILFRALRNKSVSDEDQQAMNELIEEYMFGRRTVEVLVEANTRYRNSDETALADIIVELQTLIEFYPRHLAKEDRVFFPAPKAYFSDKAALWFDRQMVHEKYKSVIEKLES